LFIQIRWIQAVQFNHLLLRNEVMELEEWFRASANGFLT
jgi:hypothetical protein